MFVLQRLWIVFQIIFVSILIGVEYGLMAGIIGFWSFSILLQLFMYFFEEY